MGTARAPERPRSAPASLPGQQTRAREPHTRGIAERAGGRIAWEAYGAGSPPVVFVPPWQIVHSRVWKAQVPDFARRHLVVTWDARGNGRSDRPQDPAAHEPAERTADLAAVMDAARVERAVLVGLSGAARPMILFAAANPSRVLGMVFVCPSSPFGEPDIGHNHSFEEELPDEVGWNRENIHAWRRDFPAYLEYFFGEAVPEPHSTKEREDGVAYGLGTDPESLAATVRVRGMDEAAFRVACEAVRCPSLVVQGTDERISHVTQGIGLAGAIPGARLVLLEGAGHIANARHPVKVNLLLRAFIRDLEAVR